MTNFIEKIISYFNNIIYLTILITAQLKVTIGITIKNLSNTN